MTYVIILHFMSIFVDLVIAQYFDSLSRNIIIYALERTKCPHYLELPLTDISVYVVKRVGVIMQMFTNIELCIGLLYNKLIINVWVQLVNMKDYSIY